MTVAGFFLAFGLSCFVSADEEEEDSPWIRFNNLFKEYLQSSPWIFSGLLKICLEPSVTSYHEFTFYLTHLDTVQHSKDNGNNTWVGLGWTLDSHSQ